MLSMKQAASRPRPPLPSAASGSTSRNVVKIDAELGQRCAGRFDHFHIGQRIDEEPPDQEFEAEVIDPLAAGLLRRLDRGQPAFDHLVAHRQRRGDEPVMRGRGRHALADRVPQLVEDQIANFGDAGAFGGGAGVGRRQRLGGGRGIGFKVHQGVAPSLTQALRGCWRKARSKARAITTGRAGAPAFRS